MRYNSSSKQRSAEQAEDLLTGRTEQFQQGNTRGSDPVHAGPAEYKHGTPDRTDRICEPSALWAVFRKAGRYRRADGAGTHL